MKPDNMTMLYRTVYWHEILENTYNMQETHVENFFRPDSMCAETNEDCAC